MRQAARAGKTSVVDEEFLIVKKKEFLCFIAEVINCTSQAKQRSEKTAIVVKSANRYLGIKDITWESIYEELQNRDKSEKPASLSQPSSQLPASILQAKPKKKKKKNFCFLHFLYFLHFAIGQKLKRFISKLETKPEIICIVETWLKPHLNFVLNGYVCELSDRSESNGGGCSTFIKVVFSY